MVNLWAHWYQTVNILWLNKEKYEHLRMPTVIILFSILLRFCNFWELPLMHDEFSALFRTQYSNFHDLILYGVKLNDSHPPGVQVFLYYWIKLFGTSAWVLKFPFAVMGVLSVWLVYLIGKRWYNETVGLFASSFVAVIQYTVFYSQLARPYSAGMFFTLWSILLWTTIVFGEHPHRRDYLLFVTVSVISASIHAFTLFFLLMQLATGFFFIRGQRLRNYLYSVLAIAILYLPELPVFLAQLGRGDIGGWLGKPPPDFLLRWIYYVFQFNPVFILVTFGIIVYFSLKYNNQSKKQKHFRLISVVWFLVTWLTAHLYSLFRSPVLQYSTLYFVFPFVVLLMFSFIRKLNTEVMKTALTALIITGVLVLILRRKHCDLMYHQGFDQIPIEVVRDLPKSSKPKTVVILQSPDTRMFDYYFKKYGLNINYFKFNKKVSFDSLNRYLAIKNPERIIYGAADFPPLFVVETLKDLFPYVEKKLSWFNSEYYVLNKNPEGVPAGKYRNREIELYPGRDKSCFLMDENKHYSKALEVSFDSLKPGKYEVLNAMAEICDTLPPGDAMLVFDLRSSDGKAVYWAGKPLKDFYCIQTTNHRYTVHFSVRRRSLGVIPENSKLKIYLWKKDRSKLRIAKLGFYLTFINPVETGLFEPLP